jgi:two-component system sensor histidine kinase CpxA
MKMPRLFWKIFFALWLSIMAFAAVVSVINQRLVAENAIEQPDRGFDINLKRFKQTLSEDLRDGGEQQLEATLLGLPRGMQKHIFVLDPDGREILKRDRLLDDLRKDRVRVAREQIISADGQTYTVVSVNRRPPRAILAPGSRGVVMRLAVAAIISALVSWLLARYLAAPLGQLSRASKLLATGDLSVRVGSPLIGRKDEFGQLAMDLDEMARRLQVSQQANRRLLRDVSHELRSPLARLRVALEIARNKDESRVVDELNRIELESDRLEKLIDEVLSLLRETSISQDLSLQNFDLSDLLTDLVETVNYEIAENAPKIEFQTKNVLIIEADRELLWRVFENLLRNALIHGGSEKPVSVSAQSVSGERLEIIVQDFGAGIAEDHLQQIFEPFYRVDEARNRKTGNVTGGHGLGLAIAASAVRQHDGQISAQNVEGGFRIRVVLPARQTGLSS